MILRWAFVAFLGWATTTVFGQDMLLLERFDNGAPGWTTTGGWQIGSAIASGPGIYGIYGDPGVDASTAAGSAAPGGVAGFVIGGLGSFMVGPAEYLTSPVIDCRRKSVLNLSFDRMLNEDLAAYVDVGIDVFDGAEWQRIWSGDGVTDAAYTHEIYDIARFAGPQLRVRFSRRVLSPAAFPLASWTIDNVCIRGSSRSVVLAEDFDDNHAGWTLGPTWQIGPAVPSPYTTLEAGQDPSVDSPARLGGGLAGVIIGGHAPLAVHDFYYLTSPAMNISGAVSARLEFARHLASDYVPYMESVVDAWDGFQWARISSNGTSPIVDPAWQRLSYDVSAYANPEFRVRFGYAIGSILAYPVSSWSIDDVVLSAEFNDVRVGDFESATPISPNPGVESIAAKSTLISPWRVEGVPGALRLNNVGPPATIGSSALGTYGGRVSQTINLPAQRACLLEFDIAPDYSDSGPGVRDLTVELTMASPVGTTFVSRNYLLDVGEQPFGSSMWRHVTLAFRTSEVPSIEGISTTVAFKSNGSPVESEVAIDNLAIHTFGIGAANTAAAGLTVDGDGLPMVPGPFVRTRDGGDSLQIEFYGPAYQPVILSVGPLNVGAAIVPCLGQIDIGTAPTFADVAIVGSGFEPNFLGYLFRLDPTGRLQFSVTLAGIPPGLTFALQGFIAVNDGNCLLQASAAHQTRVD